MIYLFKEEFNTQKLNLYLNVAARGFVLLQVNDKRYERNIIDMISSMCPTIAFDLKETDFRDGIEYLKTNKEVQVLLYHSLNSHNEKLRSILEKINLSRDLLLAQDRIVVFIVPRYAAFMIQDEFPDLYSYFSLKEVYIKDYPLLFDFIFPDKKYLITKKSQNEFKNFFFASKEGIEERLDYYMQKKVKEAELVRLKKDFEEYLGSFHLVPDEYDKRYYYTLLLRMASVCVVQEDYKYAMEKYDEIVTSPIVLSSYQGIYYETWMQKADIYFKQRNYKEAIEVYKYVISMIADQHDYENVDIFLEYVVKICSRMAICCASMKAYEDANNLMHGALNWAEQRSDEAQLFSLIYNQIVLAICEGNIEETTICLQFDSLKKLCGCEVQNAMYLSLYAWYRGIICGHRRHALNYAYEALKLKRKNLNENDVRIAESHYLISILHLLGGETEHAVECRKKGVNILSNYQFEKERIDAMKKGILE